MALKKKDWHFFKLAYNEAKQSDFCRFQMGCVITYKGHIIGRGHNSGKTDTMQKHYNKYRHFNKTKNGIKHSIHCEIAALKSIPYPVQENIDWSKVHVYIYRISPGHDLGVGISKPCAACRKALLDRGINKIYYTTNNGYCYEEIY